MPAAAVPLIGRPRAPRSRSNPPAPPSGLVAAAQEGRANALRLEFVKPVDNGGRKVRGYHVFVRHAESARFFPESWVWNGMYDATAIGSFDFANVFVLVENLISKSSFEFRLSAFNVIGNSSISVISNSAFTANTLTVPIKDHPNSDVVYGAGFQARARSQETGTHKWPCMACLPLCSRKPLSP